MKYTKEDKREALDRLQEILKPGTKVYTLVKHVSASGMYRVITSFVIYKGEPVVIDWQISRLLDLKHISNGGVGVSGCGLDMGFHLIYETSRVVFPKGFKVKGIGRNGDTSGYDKDGGYALKQEWL